MNVSRFAIGVVRMAIVVTMVAIAPENRADAENDSHAIALVKPYVHDGTWCVLCSDFDRWISMDASAARELHGLLPSIGGKTAEQRTETFLAAIPEIRQLGVQHGWMTLGIDDLLSGDMLLILSAEPAADRQRLLDLAKNAAPAVAVRRDEGVTKTSMWVNAHGVAIGGSERIVERYSSVVPAERPDLLEPLAEMMDRGALTAVVLSIDPNTRRVLRELWPDSLPAPLDTLTGATFADDVQWIGAELRDQPQPMVRLTIALHDEPTAAALLTWIERRRELLVNETSADAERREQSAELVTALQPRREVSRLVLDLEAGGGQAEALRTMTMRLVAQVQGELSADASAP